MAALDATALSFRNKLFTGLKCPFHRHSKVSFFVGCGTTLRRSTQVATMALFHEPRNLKMHADNFGKKLQEAFPEPVKEFRWKKANEIIVERLLFVGEKALKWSLITLIIISSLSDAMLSISRNRELMIPLGLFVGCVMADFLKEISQELFQHAKEGSLSRLLLAIGFFFVLVKGFSIYITGRFFLSHVGNGGLMQVLWLWKKLQEQERNKEESLVMSQDAIIKSNTED